MPKGVCFRSDRKTKPYCVRIGRSKQHFRTEEEAVNALVAHRAAKVATKAAAREILAGKRARDVAISGNNSTQERDVALSLVAAWREAFGLPALVLNDGTRADVLLGLCEDEWLPLQLKTTSGAMKYRPNAWRFSDVTGYGGMPVVCWRCDVGDAWVYDGDVLQARGKSELTITPKGKNCNLALARNLDLAALVAWLHAHADRWPAVTEDAARYDFASENHALEMRGIDAYRSRFPNRYAFPEGQNTHVDLLKDDETRLQFKTAHRAPGGSAGFVCHLSTHAGRDEAGNNLTEPYPIGVFDELIVVTWVEDMPHFWKIPAAELEARGYLCTEAQPGRVSLSLHAPTIGVQPNPNATCKADTWTAAFYI